MRVAIIGGGYVGLSTYLILYKNNDITLVDPYITRDNFVNFCHANIPECSVVQYINESINFINLIGDLQSIDWYFIAVPTNYNESNNTLDTSGIDDVIHKIYLLNPHSNICIRSTIPIGYSDNLSNKYKYMNIVYCPEFIREGHLYTDTYSPDRIVIGGIHTDICNIITTQFIEPPLIYTTSRKEAEVIKLLSNMYLSMRLSFFNELNTISYIENIDYSKILSGICSDKRIGDYYNIATAGYSGRCLPKDSRYISNKYNELPLMGNIYLSNENRKKFIEHNPACINYKNKK